MAEKAINKFKVPRKKWDSWTTVGKHVFNKTYEYMMENADLFQHPKVTKVQEPFWKTTAWNAAWIAADICSRGERHILKEFS